jgi:hypothetical protein
MFTDISEELAATNLQYDCKYLPDYTASDTSRRPSSLYGDHLGDLGVEGRIIIT